MSVKSENSIDLQGLYKIINSAAPTAGGDLVNLDFLQAFIEGARDPKNAARVATIANITLNAAPNTLDDIPLALNDRILVKNQSTGAQNGLYIVQTLGTGSDGVWVRASDADTSAEVTQGLFCYVVEGTVNARTGWLLNTPDPITLGTTALTFVQVNGLADVNAGAALSKTGNTLDVNVDNSTIAIVSDQLQIHSGYVGQTSIVTVGTIATGTWNGTAIGIAYGGTGATDAATARTNLSAAKSGANSDITALSGLTTALSVAQGGTGATTASGARSNLGTVGVYRTTLTAGQAVYNVTHNLSSNRPSSVELYNASTGAKGHFIDVNPVSSSVVQVTFGANTTDNWDIVVTA